MSLIVECILFLGHIKSEKEPVIQPFDVDTTNELYICQGGLGMCPIDSNRF